MPIPEENSDEQDQTRQDDSLFDDDPAPATPEASASENPPALPKRVRLGCVEGDIHRVPFSLVQMLTASSGERIAALQGSPTVASLQKRVRDTEGRCAPVIFTAAPGDKRPHLFAGLETVAAAMNLGLGHLHVVTIAVGDAGAAQAYLASRTRGGSAFPTDDLVEDIG